jgi:hypothetical protein
MNNNIQHPSLFDQANKAWDSGNLKLALELFLAAAKAGDDDALNSVGYFFDHGIGIKKDSLIAYGWYKRAAMRGNLAGILNMGIWFRDLGNLRRSKFWFERAYARGDGTAAYELGKIYMRQRSSLSRQHAAHYFRVAAMSKYIDSDERESAQALLCSMLHE